MNYFRLKTESLYHLLMKIGNYTYLKSCKRPGCNVRICYHYKTFFTIKMYVYIFSWINNFITSLIILQIWCWTYQIWDTFLSVLYFLKNILVVFDIFHFSTSYNSRIHIQFLHNTDPNRIISYNVSNFHLHSSNNHNLYDFRSLPICNHSMCTRIRMIHLMRRNVNLKIIELLDLLQQSMISIKEILICFLFHSIFHYRFVIDTRNYNGHNILCQRYGCPKRQLL